MKITLAILASLLLCISCKNPKSEEISSENEETVATEELCFRNEYSFPDSTENIDVLNLDLHIKGDSVTGNYNWLPALKDQRHGTLEGTIENKTITATYRYMQEGIEETAEITIVLKDDKAIITGDNPNSGLDTEVAKIQCNVD
ncbi:MULTISPECIES: hypothetical protein [Aequorivita]|uniref:Lipoprotein n=1 Tax=Aequorivita iocasae TaxID=2803865 RepID=A0ABX7DU92_9FLAO|nr:MULTISPECIES: hypothetical protein [Aequorivita]QQX77568.1 hypothetical protein JK629_04685 [Aequorivita iocasae]UCA57061.1 hypothetical protein LDL78_04710 [Aequorivita sp. F7]